MRRFAAGCVGRTLAGWACRCGARQTHGDAPSSTSARHDTDLATVVPAADIVSERTHERRDDAATEEAYSGCAPGEGAVSLEQGSGTDEVEMRKLVHLFSQDGAFIGATVKDREQHEVDERQRRRIVRVPQPEVEYRPNETSFRRLPRDVRLPNEYELRALYPMTTSLTLVTGEAHCVDHSAIDIDVEPAPMSYTMLAPPGWCKEKEYPYMVVLPDHRGVPRDFEDVCAHFFERPLHRRLMLEQEWVVLSPVVNLRHNMQIPVEGVVARFCDWVCEEFRVEHNRVHLFGKGNGGYVALRTALEHKHVAISVTALLGRSGSPFRPFQRPQEKVKNYNAVHSLVFVPGLLRKQDWYYKFKLMMDMARVRPPLRNIHVADVLDHQIYYAINPYEFWNYMRYFRHHHMHMITESGYTI